MDIDLEDLASEIGRDRPVWVKDGEYKHIPHAPWANADVPNSPTLTRLFKRLALETKDLPDDIEDLILPAPLVNHSPQTGTEVITWSDLSAQSCNENTLLIMAVDEDSPGLEIESGPIGTLSKRPSKRLPQKPFRFRDTDAWFPSGAQLKALQSPFGELYHFPTHGPTPTQRFRSSSSMTRVQSLQNDMVKLSSKITILQRAGLQEHHPGMLPVMKDLADTFFILGKYREAERWYRKIVTIQPENDNTWSEQDFEVRLELMDVLSFQEKHLEAKSMLECVCAAITKRFLPTHEIYQKFMLFKVHVIERAGDKKAGEAICRDLVQLCLVHLGPRNEETVDAIYNLAYIMRGREQFLESERLQRIALQLYQENNQWLDFDICWSLMELASGLKDQGRLDEALKIYYAASEMAGKELGEEHPATMETYYRLGVALQKKGHLQESEKLLVTTVQAQIKVLGEDDLTTLWTMYALGNVLSQGGNHQQSAVWLKRCFENSLTRLPFDNRLIFDSCEALGELYEKQGAYMDALAVYEEGLGAFRATQGDYNEDISTIQSEIKRIHQLIEEEKVMSQGTDDEKVA
jgi:tetratricopeptide (TPR) repeat protein